MLAQGPTARTLRCWDSDSRYLLSETVLLTTTILLLRYAPLSIFSFKGHLNDSFVPSSRLSSGKNTF